MSYSSSGASPYGALPGLSNHPPAASSPDDVLAPHLSTSQYLPHPDQQQAFAAQTISSTSNYQSHLANAHAYDPLPGLLDPLAQPDPAPQPSHPFPQPVLYNMAQHYPPQDVARNSLLPQSLAANAHGRTSQQSEEADTSEELEEGELSDSDFEPDPLPEHADTGVSTDTYHSQEYNPVVAAKAQVRATSNGSNHMDHDRPVTSTSVVDSFSIAYLHEQRQAAKAFIKFSGLTYKQLAEEGFNEAMLQSLFQELGIPMEPDFQTQPPSTNPAGTAGTATSPNGNTSQPPKPANREEYLARLKALQKKPSSIAISEKPVPRHAAATTKAMPPAPIPVAKQGSGAEAQNLGITTCAIRITGTTNEKQARNIFSKANRGKIRRVEKFGNDLAFYFDSAEDMRLALDQLPFHYKQPGKGKLQACELLQTNSSLLDNQPPTTPAASKSSPALAIAKLAQSVANDEDAAVRLRKEKLARLREEALKSAKAAQAKKELAAARAGAWLDNFSTESMPASSTGTPVPTPANLKRPATSEFANSSSGPSVKRPFGQPRYEDEQGDCIIEASDDEANSDSGKASTQPHSHQTGLAKATQPKEGLEAHELKIQEMRRKILELEQRNKAKARSGTSTPAPDVRTPTPSARSTTIPVPLLAQSSLTRRETPVPAGVSPAEWKKQRRDQIQSTLPAYNAKVASTANKLAMLRKQMMELEESMQQEESERQRLLQELESLGMDTETMPDMPIEELKATRDELNAQLEAQATDEHGAVSEPPSTDIRQDDRPAVESRPEPEAGITPDVDIPITVAPPDRPASTASGSTDADNSTDNEGVDAMDISGPESDEGEDYEPSEAPPIALHNGLEGMQKGSHDQTTVGPYQPPEPRPVVVNLPLEGLYNQQADPSQAKDLGHADDDERASIPTIPEEFARGATINHQFPAVVNLDSDGDSIYGNAADEEGPKAPGDKQAPTTNDFNLSSTDEESNALAQEVDGATETRKDGQGTSDSTSETDSMSSGDASMDESESEDDYEPPEVSVPPEQPTAFREEPSQESFSESASSSLEDSQQALEDGEDDENEAYAPPDAAPHLSLAQPATGDVLDNAVYQATADYSPLILEKQTFREGSASGNIDVGTTAHPITCTNEGQESLRKVTDAYKPYESPLKMFKSYRQHPDFQKEVAGGFSSLTFSNSIDSDTPLCPFEAAGGVCNDTKCNGQHFRTMSLSAEGMLKEMAALNPAYSEEEGARFSEGLSTLLADFVKQGRHDNTDMASQLAAYRRGFLGDASQVLNL